MSLTKAEWVEMWTSVKYMESIVTHIKDSRRGLLMKEINKMKQQIQSVIGQME